MRTDLHVHVDRIQCRVISTADCRPVSTWQDAAKRGHAIGDDDDVDPDSRMQPSAKRARPT